MSAVEDLYARVRARAQEGTLDLDALYAEGLKDRTKGPLYKTVATFAGLTGRKLWLKTNATAQTDGHEILAPLEDPYAYQLVEHELAHILFQSNVSAKVRFIKGFTQQMNESMKRNNLSLLAQEQIDALEELLNTVIGVLEDVRIESLWGLLYPGSYAIMQTMHTEMIRPLLKNSHRTLASFLVIASTGIKMPLGEYDRFLPALEEAMRKVERRGFTATLIVSKWLIQKLVDEAVRRKQGLKPDAAAQVQAKSLAAQALGNLNQNPLAEAKQDQASFAAQPGASFQPPPVESNPTQRKEALADLIRREDTPSALVVIADDWKAPKFPKRDEDELGAKMAKAALEAKTGDAEMEAFLSRSETKMRERVEELRVALTQQVEVDGWITKNAFGKVNIKDVKGSKAASKLDTHDSATVSKLRALFYRVLGRRKTMLHEAGSVIDVMAYIESRISRQAAPCFTQDDRGRGFKVLVLIDRSSSMEGEKTKEAERACKVLSKALDFPFVDFHVWGFQSKKDGELDLTRFDRRALAFSTKTAKVEGNTPLHLALKVAVRFMELGDEAKQIIIITDGWPSYASKRGGFSTKTLSKFVREEVQRARRAGMNVTGVVIGNDMKDAGLSFMLGAPTNWKRMTAGNLGDGLVRVVSSSFTKYLRNG